MKATKAKPSARATKADKDPKPEGVHQTVCRKRNAIVSSVRCVALPPEYNVALATLEEHLHSIRKRFTVERRFVLEMLYQLTQPVDTSTLHRLICEQMGNVALPTVYSTLELLVQLRLARRLELVSHGMAFFERTLGLEPHGYVACSQCGSVSILNAPELLQQFQGQMPRGFHPDDFTLVVHGLCAKCQRKSVRRKKT